MNEAVLATIFTFIGGAIVKIIESLLKRKESEQGNSLARDKQEFDQETVIRDEIRKELIYTRARIMELEKERNDALNAQSRCQAEQTTLQAALTITNNEKRALQEELARFERRVYYDPNKPKKEL